MATVLFIAVYLMGIPFMMGLLGEKCSKMDWAISIFLGIFSWAGVTLFFVLTTIIFATTKLYSLGVWVQTQMDRIPW